MPSAAHRKADPISAIYPDSPAPIRGSRKKTIGCLQHCPKTASASPEAGVGGESDRRGPRSEEHTSELQSLMRISYAVFCLKKNKHKQTKHIREESSSEHQQYISRTITH